MKKADSNIISRSIYRKIEDVPSDQWNAVAKRRNIYLSIDYLSSLESEMNNEIDFYYVISYDSNKKPILISSFQLVKFIDKRKAYSKQLYKLSYHVHKKILDAFTINVLVCGSVFADGENGFLWSDDISSDAAINEISEVTNQLKKEESIKDKFSMTLFKDFWPKSKSFSDRLKEFSYRDFMIDVNMVLHIHNQWLTVDDYFASMKTKFRTRAKSVYKKAQDVQLRSLDKSEILAYSSRLQDLFENVLDKSDFSFGKLNVKAFANFSEKLGDNFVLKGAFLDDKLVGFSTSFMNGDSLEANYVGLDYQYNIDHSVYQRILYDYVEQAIDRKAKDLQLGRTSELIKSSIGAIPMNMKLYIKHNSGVSNLLLKPIIQSISPSEFELRKPFKSNFAY